MTMRDYMREHDENMYWCKPFLTEDGSVAYTSFEARINDIKMDGAEKHGSDITAEDLNALARRLESFYDCCEGYTDTEIIFTSTTARESACHECPWFEDCAAMDDPVDFNEPEADG